MIELILERARTNSQPGARRDNCRLALAFEGGGMRGVTSAGMGFALVQLGLTDVFDVVYGSSAGSFNSAYFVSRQGGLGISVYYEDINNSRFVSLIRGLLGGRAIDLDYALNVAMTEFKPLDYEAIARSKIGLRVLAANLSRRKTVVFDRFESRQDLMLKLQAGASMPYLAGPPVDIGGEKYSDASLYESIPFRSAIDPEGGDPCTHVLALRSRPQGVVRAHPSWLERWYLARSLRQHDVRLYDDYVRRPSHYSDDLERLALHTQDHSKTPYMFSVFLEQGSEAVSPFERRRNVLVQSAAAGMRAMIRALTGEEAKVLELLTPLRADGRPFVL